MAPPRNLVLIGFMGSGKSAVGRRVAADLGLPFVDIDDAVVTRARRPIVEIFAVDGEAAFRRLEAAALRRALGGRGQVIAPGGGALIDDDSWKRVMDRNLVVFLNATPRALLRRIRTREEARDAGGALPANIRPLAAVEATARRWPRAARRRVLALLEARLPRYSQAPILVETTGRGADAVARQVGEIAREARLGG